MEADYAGYSRNSLGPLAAAIVFALAAQTAAAQPQDSVATQLSHPTGESVERIPASRLQESCLLIATFQDEGLPEDYDEVALAEGWTGVLKKFNDDETRFMALCLGNEPPRAHVWLESVSENGRFMASGPQYPPNWQVGDGDALCLAGKDDGCSIPYLHEDSGFLYLSFVLPEGEGDDDGRGGNYVLVVQSEDNAPIYADIEAALNAAADQ